MSRYACVLFDLDGTLLDTERGVMTSIDDTIEKLGFPQLSPEIKKTFVGPPIFESFQRCYGLSDKDATRAQNHFREVYPQKHLFEAQRYDGMDELLAGLKADGVLLGVATNKPQAYAIPLLEHFGFQAYFDVMLGSQAPRLNNKADVVRECLMLLGVADPRRAVLVGDTMHDQRGAEQSGVDFLAVSYGFGFTAGDTAQAVNAVAMCADPQAVAAFLKKAIGRKDSIR